MEVGVIHRAVGVHADALDAGVLLLEEARRARNRPARPRTRDEVGDAALGLLPQLRPRRVEVRLRVGGVVVLVRVEGVGDLLGEVCSRRSSRSAGPLARRPLGRR